MVVFGGRADIILMIGPTVLRRSTSSRSILLDAKNVVLR
jgi:hypothetical protein